MIPRFKPTLGWDEFAALFRRNTGAVEQFEKEFAKAFHAVDAVAFPYGRSAQWAFFNAVGLKNAEIIMPAYTCSVVAHAITLSGNRPRFIDICIDDYNMNLDLVVASINEHTRAIIATHTFGYPQNIDKLEEIVRLGEARYGNKIWLMQDCCHAFGATWNGRLIGTSGDVAVYAFNISKLITSIFGGMLTFQDQKLATKLRQWRNNLYAKPNILKSILRRLYLLSIYIAFNEKIYGMTWWLQEKSSLLNRFTKSYHLDEKIHFPPDYLERMLDVEAAVGLVQLERYTSIIATRRKNAEYYDKHLRRRENWKFPRISDGATYSHYVVQVPDRKQTVNEFAKKDIQLGELIQYCIPDIDGYQQLEQRCPIAEASSKHTINFPLTLDDVSKICAANDQSV